MENAVFIKDVQVMHLAVDMIKTNPYQPRKFFEKAGLIELSKSIKEYGIMQPITVRVLNSGTYELVAGERRLRASKMAGLSTIPAVIVKVSEQESAIMAMIENLQRQNLNFIEEAEGFQNLMHDYLFTQEALAEKLGKSQSTIANKIRILRLSKDVLRIIMDNELSERHARALLKLDDEKLQIEVLNKVIKDGLNVKRTEELVELVIKKRGEPEKSDKKNQKIKYMIRNVKVYTNDIKQTVDKMKESGINTDFFVEESETGCDIMICVKYS